MTVINVACSSSSPFSNGATDSAAPDAAESDAGVPAPTYGLNVPGGYDPATPIPLVVMMHGYGVTGPLMETDYFQLTATSEGQTFLYAYPDHAVDQDGQPFWNATDACCDFYGAAPDDVAYFDRVVDDIASKYNLDPKRIYVVGHSNGGFMAHRLACDRAARIAAVVSIAGAQWEDPTRCQPTAPISVVELHGDQDKSVGTEYGVDYNGGSTWEGTYPSAHDTVATWAQKNGCSGALTDSGQTLDLVPSLSGAETRVDAYAGCPAGIDVQLWTIQGGGHMDPLNTVAFGQSMWTFMNAHAKP